MKRVAVVSFWLLWHAFGASAQAQSSEPTDARIVTADIDRFWAAYDRLGEAASYEDSLRTIFEGYYLPASPGLRDFIKARIGSVYELLDVMKRHPRYYASIRGETRRVASMKPEIGESFRRMADLYPEAVFPDVYFVIGRLTSAGTTSSDKLLIGTEMIARPDSLAEEELADWLRQVLRPIEGAPAIVAHELIHVQQNHPETRTLLGAAIKEGAADFLGEMISGGNINSHVHEWANPRERELWEDFRQIMNGRDFGGWLYGRRAEDEPNDLGYWMGYRIVKAYYESAPDKRQAIRDILNIRDFDAFLNMSGYDPAS